jgi:hypothetical protein
LLAPALEKAAGFFLISSCKINPAPARSFVGLEGYCILWIDRLMQQSRLDAVEPFEPVRNSAELAHRGDVFSPQHVPGSWRQTEILDES